MVHRVMYVASVNSPIALNNISIMYNFELIEHYTFICYIHTYLTCNHFTTYIAIYMVMHVHSSICYIYNYRYLSCKDSY